MTGIIPAPWSEINPAGFTAMDRQALPHAADWPIRTDYMPPAQAMTDMQADTDRILALYRKV